jgi:hypothetical protein
VRLREMVWLRANGAVSMAAWGNAPGICDIYKRSAESATHGSTTSECLA